MVISGELYVFKLGWQRRNDVMGEYLRTILYKVINHILQGTLYHSEYSYNTYYSWFETIRNIKKIIIKLQQKEN